VQGDQDIEDKAREETEEEDAGVSFGTLPSLQDVVRREQDRVPAGSVRLGYLCNLVRRRVLARLGRLGRVGCEAERDIFPLEGQLDVSARNRQGICRLGGECRRLGPTCQLIPMAAKLTSRPIQCRRQCCWS
jgi:hypothetical protein